MSLAGRPMRGLGDLRTLAGRSDMQIPAHKAYLRISFLELEKARHAQEVRTAQHRLGVLGARFREIDAETNEILANLNNSAPRSRPPEDPHRSPVGRRQLKRSFQLSY